MTIVTAKRVRRTDEQMIASLEAEIQRLKHRAAQQKVTKAPAIKYTTNAIVGSGPAATKFVSPQNYLYTFSTSGVSGSSNTLALNHK